MLLVMVMVRQHTTLAMNQLLDQPSIILIDTITADREFVFV